MKKVIETAQQKFEAIAKNSNVHFVTTVGCDDTEMLGCTEMNETHLYFHDGTEDKCYKRTYDVSIEDIESEIDTLVSFVNWICKDHNLDTADFLVWLRGSYFDEHYFRLWCEFVYESYDEFTETDITDDFEEVEDEDFAHNQMMIIANCIEGRTFEDAYGELCRMGFVRYITTEDGTDDIEKRMYVYTSNCRFIIVGFKNGEIILTNDVLVDDKVVSEDSDTIRAISGFDEIKTLEVVEEDDDETGFAEIEGGRDAVAAFMKMQLKSLKTYLLQEIDIMKRCGYKSFLDDDVDPKQMYVEELVNLYATLYK